MMGSYPRVLPAFHTLHSFSVTLFTLGRRLFYPVAKPPIKYFPPREEWEEGNVPGGSNRD
jgi:hypothetical protein